MANKKMETLYPYVHGKNSMALMQQRLGHVNVPIYPGTTVEGSADLAKRLQSMGGYPQQNRMIRDKRNTLDNATKYSYQGAWVKRVYYDFEPLMEGVREASPVRALVNPNKLKPDYDDKVISVGFEHGFQPGDVFEWCNTKSHWLIYLQDLTELAYFRGDCRKCQYQIPYIDKNGEKKTTYIALRGPVETRIESISKLGLSVDIPNRSVHFYVSKNPDTMEQFKRYSKFYLNGTEEDSICWRVEATDSFSTPGILEVTAVEYYANKDEDDIENGLVGALIVEPDDPNTELDPESTITGETFIKPKKEYIYYVKDALYGHWYISDTSLPVSMKEFIDDEGHTAIRLKWLSTYSGTFNIWYGDEDGPLLDYQKTIIVESLF